MTAYWIPAPRFYGDKFTPAETRAGMTEKRNKVVFDSLHTPWRAGTAFTRIIYGR